MSDNDSDVGGGDDIDFEDDDEDDAQARRRVRRDRVYKQRRNFTVEDLNADLSTRFRLNNALFDLLYEEIGEQLEPRCRQPHSLSAREKILLALRVFASGSDYEIVADAHGVSAPSVYRAVVQVTDALNGEPFNRHVRFPDDFEPIVRAYHQIGRMPSVFGCMDGCLVEIESPVDNEQDFVDRHHRHSINLMAVCGPERKFYFVDANWPGRTHDGRVYNNSELATRIEGGWRPTGNGIILADSGYQCNEVVITPLVLARQLTPEEERFNTAHRRTRALVENTFGLWKNQWRLMRKLHTRDAVFGARMINATIVLHNMMRDVVPDDVVGLDGLDDEPHSDDDDDERLLARFGRQRRNITPDTMAGLRRQRALILSFTVA